MRKYRSSFESVINMRKYRSSFESEISAENLRYLGKTPLMHAVESAGEAGEIEVDLIEFLKCSVNSTDWRGRSALHHAAELNNAKSVKLLIECANANVNASDCEGFTPLMLASAFGSESAVKELVNQGAEILLTNLHGMTAIALAKYRFHPDVVGELLCSLVNGPV
jgi:ankyrin repeat protein